MRTLKVLAIALLAIFSVTAVNAQMSHRRHVTVRHHRHMMVHHQMMHHHS